MIWELEYLPEAQADLDALDNSIRQAALVKERQTGAAFLTFKSV